MDFIKNIFFTFLTFTQCFLGFWPHLGSSGALLGLRVAPWSPRGSSVDPAQPLQTPSIPGRCLHFTPCFAMLHVGTLRGPFETIVNSMHPGFRVSSAIPWHPSGAPWGAEGCTYSLLGGFLGLPGDSLGCPREPSGALLVLSGTPRGLPGLPVGSPGTLPGHPGHSLWTPRDSPGLPGYSPWTPPPTPPRYSPGVPGAPRGLPGVSRDSPGSPGTLPGLPGYSPGTPRGTTLWLPGGTAEAGWRTTWELHEYRYMQSS